MNNQNFEEQEISHDHNTRSRAKRTERKTSQRGLRTVSEGREEGGNLGSLGTSVGKFRTGSTTDGNTVETLVARVNQGGSESELSNAKHVVFVENKQDAKNLLEELGRSLKNTFNRSDGKLPGTGIKPILKKNLSQSVPQGIELGSEIESGNTRGKSESVSDNIWRPIAAASSVVTSESEDEVELSTLADCPSSLTGRAASVTNVSDDKVSCQAIVQYRKSDNWKPLSERAASPGRPLRLVDLAGVINSSRSSELAIPLPGHHRKLPSPPPFGIPFKRTNIEIPELTQNQTDARINSYPAQGHQIHTNLFTYPSTSLSTPLLKTHEVGTVGSCQLIPSEPSQLQSFTTSQITPILATPQLSISYPIPILEAGVTQTERYNPNTPSSVPTSLLSNVNPQLPESRSPTVASFVSDGLLNTAESQDENSHSDLFQYDDDIEMAYTTPTIFRGTSQENAVGWLRHAKWWLDTTRAGSSPDLRLKLHQLAVLFQDEAENWFANLRIAGQSNFERSMLGEGSSAATAREDGVPVITSWEDFERVFMQRFKRDESARTGDIAALIQMKQAPGQTVEEFVAVIRKQGTLVNATHQDMYMAVVTGLSQHIKAQIMQFDPITLDEIVKRGKVAERYPIYPVPSRPISASDTTTSREKLNQLISAVNELSIGTPPAIPRQSHPDTPVRVRFSSGNKDADSERDSPRRGRSQTPTRSEQEPRFGRDISRERPGTPPLRRQEEREGRRGDNNQLRYHPYANDMRSGNSGAQRPYEDRNRRLGRGHGRVMEENNWRNERCDRCGRGHGDGGRCPAATSNCVNCGRRGHWRACCRGGRGVGSGPGRYAEMRPPPFGGGFQ